MIYNRPTPTFVQWQMDITNYGINFTNEEDAIIFEKLLSTITSSYIDKKIKRGSVKPKKTKKKRQSESEESSSQESTIESPEDEAERKKRELRDKAAFEILSSEESYIKSLKQLKEMWIEPMKSKGIINDNDYNLIFSNIENIIIINENLQSELKSRINNWSQTQKIGDVFLRNVKIFQLYKPYCENYDNAIAHIKLLSKKKAFSSFCKAAESKCDGFSISFYLIMPIQRIPRYQLLIKELLSKTPPDHPDYEDLKSALNGITELATNVNKGVADAVQQKRLQEVISKNFQGLSSLILERRYLILDGELDISLGTLGKSNYCILFNDIIVFATDNPKVKQVNTQLDLPHAWIMDVPEMGDCCFQIISPEMTVFITTKDKVTKDKWFSEIQNTIDKWLSKNGIYKEGQENVPSFDKVRIMTYHFAEGSFYKGEWFRAKMQGSGKYTSANGSTFEGEFMKGVMHGYGIAKYRNGEIYEGEWERDIPHGKGKLSSPAINGSQNVYDGEWEKGRKKGKGKMIWENGDVYEGEWEGDRFHGFGSLIKKDGTKYIGEWQNGNRHGKGTFYGASGEVYEGEWENNLKHGKGRLTLSNNEVYEGEFVHERKSGKGVWTYEGTKYDGEWMEDKRHGFGTITLSNGTCYQGHFRYDKKSGLGVLIEWNGDKYDGNWSDDKRNGKGIWSSASGNTYDGEWKDDKKSGFGTYTSSDGVVYVGEWMNDRREGKGKETWKNGCCYEGNWKADAKHGFGTFTWADKSSYTGEWMFGVREGKGTLITSSGKYEGEWKNGKRDGFGVWEGNDGSSYSGEWKEDRKHNKGVYSTVGMKEDQIWKEGLILKPGIKYFAPDLPVQYYF